MDKDRFKVYLLCPSDCSEIENTETTTPLTGLPGEASCLK